MTMINGTQASESLTDVGVDTDSTLNANWSLGEDRMAGGTGDDTYYVNSSGDQVIERAGEGTDTVVSQVKSYTLGSDVENLTLSNAPTRVIDLPGGGTERVPAAVSGTGNGLDNTLLGNDLDNVLSGLDGDDTLRGRLGDDLLQGGNGRDYLDGGDGGDSLLGGNGDDTLYGDYGDDLLYGGAGADRLDGGAGADILVGGFGDDRYYVNDAADMVVESGLFGGTDHVYSRISHTLARNVENLTLDAYSGDTEGRGNGSTNQITGSYGSNQLFGLGGNDQLYGEYGNDTLDGGSGRDLLAGQAGRDVLTGGSGQDRFVFDAVGVEHADKITDFSHADDTIVLGNGLDIGLDGAKDQGLLGLSFSDANAGQVLADAWFFKGAGMTGGVAGQYSGIYVNTLDGQVWYNPTTQAGGDSLLLGSVSVESAGQLTASDFVFGG